MVPAEAEEARAAAIATSHPLPISASLAQRQAQYPHIHALHQHGLAPSQIALRVGLSERNDFPLAGSWSSPPSPSPLLSWSQCDRSLQSLGAQTVARRSSQGLTGVPGAQSRGLSWLRAGCLSLSDLLASNAGRQQSKRQPVGLLCSNRSQRNKPCGC